MEDSTTIKQSPPSNEEPIENEDEIIRIVNQGTYGCILRPGFKCDNKTIDSKKYITKIQLNNAVLENEINISEKIKTIPLSNLYFSPIISSCNVNIGEIENESIKECSIIAHPENLTSQPPPHEYISNKIRYVGDKTLGTYLPFVYESRPDMFLTIFIETQLQLLDGYRKLRDVGIIHFDIKENNIIMDEINSQPVIIDFGMSFYPSQMTKDNFTDVILTYDEYPPWCVDIFMLSHIAGLSSQSWKDMEVNKEEIRAICEKFVRHPTNIFMKISSETRRIEFQAKLNKYFMKFVGQTWETVYDDLVKYMPTWDNYSVAMMYLMMAIDLKLNNYITKYKFIKQYIDELKHVIYSTPEERPSIEIHIQNIRNIFTQISEKELESFMRNIQLRFQNPEYIEEVDENIQSRIALEDEDDQTIFINKQSRTNNLSPNNPPPLSQIVNP